MPEPIVQSSDVHLNIVTEYAVFLLPSVLPRKGWQDGSQLHSSILG